MYTENVLMNSTFSAAFDKKIFVGNLSIGSNLSTKDSRKAWEDAFMTTHLNSVLSVSISCKNSYIFPKVYNSYSLMLLLNDALYLAKEERTTIALVKLSTLHKEN